MQVLSISLSFFILFAKCWKFKIRAICLLVIGTKEKLFNLECGDIYITTRRVAESNGVFGVTLIPN